MKCPKCEYLGFETGDRCRNCGYDFSLIGNASIAPASDAPFEHDLDLHVRDDPRPQPPPSFRGEPALPLFGAGAGDEPLIKVPATPRPPLAVRRTPDTPRLRQAARQQRPVEPTLAFQDPQEPQPSPETPLQDPFAAAPASAVAADRRVRARAVASGGSPPIGRRIWAAALDHLILLAIDVVVVDFTLRLASLTWADWRMLPAVPLVAFLVFIKLAYFSAFTAVGGQTIGKMAAGIRVIADDAALIDPARAVRRTIVGPLSLAAFGAGLIPLLFGDDRRPLHDRVAHTRVVTGPAV